MLKVNNLSVAFKGTNQVVHNVNFSIDSGKSLALVGESGSGKSVTALSILRLHNKVTFPTGQIEFQGQDLLKLSEAELRQIRGKDVAMIFQEPMTSLNPVYPIGQQLIEPLLLHKKISKSKARRRMLELLELTGIPEPQKRFNSYPQTLSGGQRQRVMIAMALACNPKLLIADEPTTALDVTIQLQILELLEKLKQEFNMAILLISHDLNLVQHFAEYICVMQKGKLVESAPVTTLFSKPQNSYTKLLLNSKAIQNKYNTTGKLMLEANKISCVFSIKSGFKSSKLKAVDNVDLRLYSGETLGIVGESGSGKTTLGLNLLQLQKCDGTVKFNGNRLDQLTTNQLRPLRHCFQVVFQDPYSSLSPRLTIEQIVGEGLIIHQPKLSSVERQQKI
ncbi:ATP-binding cassette domain-containing protein, partial [Thiotrichales bacterium HSG1]|nr:ATP-binding cassette domain-containing protein [Thiotrichales bacterium HSG1]